VSLLARARKEHRRLLACGLSDHYVEIFQITRLADFLSIFPDEASALTQEKEITYDYLTDADGQYTTA
jgi:hypothetical protein